MSFHCDSLVLVLFCLCVCFLCCFLFFGCGFVACFVFLVAVFFFSHRGIISFACTTNQKLITASASTAEFTQRVNTCITTLREQLRRWSKKKRVEILCTFQTQKPASNNNDIILRILRSRLESQSWNSFNSFPIVN